MTAGARVLRCAIVGFGKVGRTRERELNLRDDTEIVAICDTIADNLSLPPNVRFSNRYRDIITDDIDAVFVATINRVTPEVVVYALDRGKHVFCEKPPGRTVEDVQYIIAAETRNPGLKLKFGFNHRYHYSIIEAKSMIRSGTFGKIAWMRGIYGKAGGLSFAGNWRSVPELAGGGVLLDQGIHMIDLFRYLAGDFENVQSVVRTQVWDIDPLEDNAFALLSNDSIIAMLHSSATQWKHKFSLEIGMSEGYINLAGILSSTRSYGEETLTFARKQFEDEASAFGKPREQIIFFDKDDSWKLEVQDFVRCIFNDDPVTNGNSHDALRAMTLVHDIYGKGRGR